MKLIAILLSFLLVEAVSAAVPRALLKESAVVDGERLRLADVAEFTDLNSELAKKLGEIDLGLAPRAGQSERVGVQKIAAFVNRHDSEARMLKWAGARQITIHRSAQTVEAEEIRTTLTSAVRSMDSSIELAKDMRPMLIPNVPYGLLVNRMELAPDCAQGRAVISAMGSENVLATMSVKFFLIPANEQSLKTGCVNDIVVEAGEVVLQPGGATRHESVEIEIREKGLILETTAIALRDAHLGEALNVRNPASNEVYRVRLVAPGRAALVLE